LFTKQQEKLNLYDILKRIVGRLVIRGTSQVRHLLCHTLLLVWTAHQ